jgi:hypothetical protein
MAGRSSVKALIDVEGKPVIGVAVAAGSLEISACDIDLEPVTWVQTNSDIVTRTVVYWLDQSPVPPDPPAEATYEIRNDAMEASTAEFGVRRLGVTSQLTSQDNAALVAGTVMARLSRNTGWRVSGLRWTVDSDEPPASVATILTLLDGTSRIGAPIVLVDLPSWTPLGIDSVGIYLEGGNYRYDDGRWVLDMLVSNAAGIGESVTWEQLEPQWSWDDFPADIAWVSLYGVGPDPNSEVV